MKVKKIEAFGLGDNQQELAAWVMRIYGDIDWPTKADFEDLAPFLLWQARMSRGGPFYPMNGGLIFDWGDD